MQLVAQSFHDQTEQRIRNGIRRQSLIETNGVVAASDTTAQVKLTRAQKSRSRSLVEGKVARAKSAQKPATRKPAMAHNPIRYFMGRLLPHISGKNGLGRFMVRHTTIRKRIRAKLRQIKQEFRERMHDPVPQTGQWLKSVVQGYFNYYAVPGNLTSLGVFRDRVLALWWRTIRRRSQKHRINWTRTLVLAQRWLPQPRALHPFPDARFAATHPR